MTLNVDFDESTSEIHISWTADDPLAFQLNKWTEKDFLNCLSNALTDTNNWNLFSGNPHS
jgi:hypothetical protein